MVENYEENGNSTQGIEFRHSGAKNSGIGAVKLRHQA